MMLFVTCHCEETQTQVELQ